MSIDQDITNLPTPPSRSDSPSDFSDKADAFLAALPQLQTELNLYADEANTTQTAINTSESNAATSEQNAEDWAVDLTGLVLSTDYSAKAYAISTDLIPEGAAKEWSLKTDGTVDTTEYSAKAYALGGTGVTNVIGSAKEWAIETAGTVDGSEFSAKKYANDSKSFSEASAGAANFVGAWDTLTGSLTVPSSVSHLGAVWVLKEDIADVTAEEPGSSDVWIEVTRALAKTPVITSPSDGAQDTAPNLSIEGSAFSPVYSADQRDYRQIQIIEAGGTFASPVVDEQISTDDYNFAGDPNSDYQVRIRDKILDSAFSAWSEIVSFNTANIFVEQPTITSPADNETDIGETPTITSSAFSVANGSDTHVASQWIITRVSDSTVVFDSGEDTSNLESIEVPAGVLDEGEVNYTVKVRHKGSTYGFSSYSPEITFTTSLSFLPSPGDAFGGGFFVGFIDTVAGTIDSQDDYQTGERYALIVAPKSLEDDSGLQWDSQDRTGEAGSFTRWDGLSSTNSILAKNDNSYEAFEHIRSIRLSDPVPADGGSDWYLPAMDELELIYRNLKPVSGDNTTSYFPRTFPGQQNPGSGFNPSSDPTGSAYTATGEPFQTGVTDFQDGGAEAVDLTRYWSSTDADEGGRAWFQYFSGSSQGSQDAFDKDITIFNVRPVRRVVL